MAKTVVVLGGSFAGLQVAHRLLKSTKSHVEDLKVILVSKNDHLYWNLASIRAIIPGQYSTEQTLGPISVGFSQYPADVFELVVGTATSVDAAGKTVTVATAGDETKTVGYDQLVLATGSSLAQRTSGGLTLPFKAAGTHTEIVAALDAMREKVAEAKHVTVAGGGPTGVELAGELAFEFAAPGTPADRRKEVVLLSATDGVLGTDMLAGSAEKELAKLGVKLVKNVKVAGTEDKDGKVVVKLDNGETLETDLYLPTFGLRPNSDYLPDAWKRDGGYAAVDEFLRVKGTEEVWAAGDIVSIPRAGFLIADKQGYEAWKNVDLALQGKAPVVAKGMPVNMMVASVGRSRAVGRMGVVRLPSLFGWLGKGRTLALERLKTYLDGSAW